MNIHSLPSEILIKIFKFLPLKTLKEVVLVCSYFSKIGADPRLWRSLNILLPENKSDSLNVLKCERLKYVREISLPPYGNDFPEIFHRLSTMEHLQVLNLRIDIKLPSDYTMLCLPRICRNILKIHLEFKDELISHSLFNKLTEVTISSVVERDGHSERLDYYKDEMNFTRLYGAILGVANHL